MVEPLSLTWYTESPIDFEHKQYILYAYLHHVEDLFLRKNLSPHLLHMEKMIDEMTSYQDILETYKLGFDKHRYIYLFDNHKLNGEDNSLLREINEIVSFSLPEIKSRVKFGYKILEKNKQILY